MKNLKSSFPIFPGIDGLDIVVVVEKILKQTVLNPLRITLLRQFNMQLQKDEEVRDEFIDLLSKVQHLCLKGDLRKLEIYLIPEVYAEIVFSSEIQELVIQQMSNEIDVYLSRVRTWSLLHHLGLHFQPEEENPDSPNLELETSPDDLPH